MRIYLDHNATTPLRDEVVDAMVAVLREGFGNPSSTHAEGAAARREVERARVRVASLVGADPGEIVFTGSATEANNAALVGALEVDGGGGGLAISRVAHPSVVEPAAALEARGHPVHRLGVDAAGRLDEAALESALADGLALVSVLWANNETGVLQPVARIAELVKAAGALFHVDATQAVGKVPVDLGEVPADLLSASAHKFNGPKGSGFLVVRGDLSLPAFVRGGPQEQRRRGGTENVAGIVGLGVAAALAEDELPDRIVRYRALRDRLWQGLDLAIGGLRRNGAPDAVLPNTLNVEFPGTPGDVLLEALDLEGVAVSAGAACASGSIEPSHVLAAMGRTPEQARGTLRLSVGHGVDEAQIDRVIALLPALVQRARAAGIAA